MTVDHSITQDHRTKKALVFIEEHPEKIRDCGKGNYIINGHQVNARLPHCDCPDFSFRGATCYHLLIATTLDEKRQKKIKKLMTKLRGECAFCHAKGYDREYVEVQHFHEMFFLGEVLCRQCATSEGVA